ncbi:hypothetical protein M5K25_019342 [Dendrobium thyrsiflorum]|uniref:Uncharacterized protein n=1 Tax=Dendrobium thyrsiflorum TaxID=117978 RepID=A0ABD0UEE1_DENTH
MESAPRLPICLGRTHRRRTNRKPAPLSRSASALDTHEHVDNRTPCSASVMDTHEHARRRPARPLSCSSRPNGKHARGMAEIFAAISAAAAEIG